MSGIVTAAAASDAIEDEHVPPTFIVRIASIFFALLLIASSVLMVLFGLNELQAVADQLTGVSTTLGDTCAFSKASDLPGSFVEKGVIAMRNRDQLVENLGVICPNCDAQGEVLVHDGDFKAVPMGYLANTLKTPLLALGDLGLSKILSLQEALAATLAGFHGMATLMATAGSTQLL